MPYRLAIFDFDGTLADSFPWFLSVLGPAARRFGFRVPDRAEAEALRAAGTRQILAALGVPLWRLPAIAAHMRALKAEAAAEIPLFAGVPALLAALRGAGVRLAIVSSDSEASIRRSLGPEAAGCIGFWDCGAGLFGKAPKLRRAVRRAGVAPTEAILIGDEMRDAEAAAEAGIDFGAVVWGYAAPEALRAARPAHAFAAVGDIAALFGLSLPAAPPAPPR